MSFPWVRIGFGKNAQHILGTHKYCSPVVPYFFMVEFHASQQIVFDGDSVAMSMTYVSFSVAKNVIHSSTAADHGNYSFGELAPFVYCLIQKIKKGSSLRLVEHWEEYVTPNH